jgi:hypothetical protein
VSDPKGIRGLQGQRKIVDNEEHILKNKKNIWEELIAYFDLI